MASCVHIINFTSRLTPIGYGWDVHEEDHMFKSPQIVCAFVWLYL